MITGVYCRVTHSPRSKGKAWAARARDVAFAVLLVVVSWVFAAGMASALTGCPPADPAKDPAAYVHEQEIKAESSYTGDLMACTAKARSLAESKRCEELADIKWGVGAPSQDAGKK